MNFVTHQFYPLHQDNELLFEISSIPITTSVVPPPYNEDHKTIFNQDMLLLSPPPPPPLSITKQDKKRRRHDTADGSDKHEGGGGIDQNKRKKIMHREVERQRRQEMASLYKSLRSLLPSQYLKGKRSIGDHMNEAKNYIRHLENKIKELNEKRDQLKRILSNLSHEEVKMKEVMIMSCCRSDVVSVQQCLAGIEVVISCTGLLGFEGVEVVLSLSKVLERIIQEGLDVVNCVSVKVRDTVFHTILSEVSNPNNPVNLSELQQTLRDLIRTSCS